MEGVGRSQSKEWNGACAGPLPPERARSECARSTGAVGPAQVPFHEKATSKLGQASNTHARCCHHVPFGPAGAPRNVVSDQDAR